MSIPGYVTVEVDLPEGWLMELGTMRGCGNQPCDINVGPGMHTNGRCHCPDKLEEAFGCTRTQAKIFMTVMRFMRQRAERETQP